jgi:hypothetical protein
MALETLSGTLAALTATEILARQSILANLPRLVLSSLVHRDALTTERSNQKRYTVESDLGAASAGIEGVDLTPTVQIGMSTSVNVSISEGVADMARISENAISTALGIDMDQVQAIIEGGTVEQFRTLLAPFVQRLIPRGLQKIEADLLAHLASLTNTVGTSGSDFTIAQMLGAQFEYRSNQPLRPITEAKYLLTENQANEINIEALATSGGVSGALWNTQARFSMSDRQANAEMVQAQGYLGEFLGYPVHAYDSELNVTANGGADVVGAFGVLGDPNRAPDDPALGGRPGAIVLLNRGSLKVRFAPHLTGRSADLVMNAHYGTGLIVNTGAVGIVTDAP